jgi:formylglycine-generating enzyme required for sulfatase activity
MVEQKEHNKETDRLVDALLALREELRAVGFDPGLQRTLAAQQLLVRLAAEGRLSKAPSEWLNWLAPVFCGSKEQQAEFDLRFPAWAKRYMGEVFLEAGRAAGVGRGETSDPAEGPPHQPSGWRRRLHFLRQRRVAFPVIFAIIVAASLVVWWMAVREPQAADDATNQPGLGTITKTKGPIEVGRPADPSNQRKGSRVPDPPKTLEASPILDWRQWLLIAMPLVLWLVWQLLAWWLRRAWLTRLPSRRLPRLEQLQVEGAEHRLFATIRDRRLLVELRRPRPGTVLDLDISETVRLTAHNGGLFTPSLGTRWLAPEYLFLIDRDGFRDEQARVAEELLLRMNESGVYVDPFYFQRDARLCQSVTDPGQAAISLGQLAIRYADHRLLIFTDGDGLTDHYRGESQPWVELFKAWENRAVLTPEDPDRWREREEYLSRAGFVLLPASAEGLDELGRWLNYDRLPAPARRPTAPFPPLIVERPGRWLERRPPPAGDVDLLLAEMRDYLGEDGWKWLLACAVYPEMTWDLTLYHGFALFGHEDHWLRECSTRLLRLVRLPWFRQSWMPDWLRQELVDRLDGPARETVRLSIDRLLRSAAENPRQPVPLTYAQPARQSLSERVRLAWRWFQVRIFAATADPAEPIRDFVFLNFMFGRRSRLGVSLPEAIRKLIYRDGLPPLGIRPVLSLTAAALVALTTAYGLISVVLPPSQDRAGLRLPPVPGPDPRLLADLLPQDSVTRPVDNLLPGTGTLTRTGDLYQVRLPNNVSLDMLQVPAGEFLMGEDENGVAEYVRECGRYNDNKAGCQDWADDSTPQHRVQVDSFLMGKYEVTQRQWRVVMGALPPGMGDLEARFKGDDLPVVRVSWDEIQQFLKKLGLEYRLPSEAEWEYAARAGTTTAYAFGSEISPEVVNFNGDYPVGSQPKGLYRGAPIAVGSLRVPNAWGLFDMHGNVWEWCADEWHDNYRGVPADGRAWVSRAKAAGRIIRGGGWYGTAVDCRSAGRNRRTPGVRAYDLGFRLSRTLP